MNFRLDDILQKLSDMPPEVVAELTGMAVATTSHLLWVPNPGPQFDAAMSEADEIFYGGEAGGGKTDLEIGLALTAHSRSLLLRRTNKEALGLVERMAEIVGHRDGWNGQHGVWRLGDRVIDIGGCQQEEDKQKYKGKPHDLICFDEVSDFEESQYTFIIGWNRSTDPNQRCRIIAAGNPPTRPEGLWVVKRWRAWLDPKYPNPAKPGELRWYTTGEDGEDTEVDGPGPHMINGEPILARSRTFIPAELADNPDLSADGRYAATLAAMPEELREAYRDGKFSMSLRDSAYQVIPTAWIKAAQARWTPNPPAGIPMCAIAADIAQGGKDKLVIARRYDGWYAPLVKVAGKQVPRGSEAAGLIVQNRKDDADIIIDLGGGYGGAAYEWLTGNGLKVYGYKGATASTARTKDKKLKFNNKRSETIWKFREALDPEQDGGSPIMLPDDPEIVADLTAPTFKVDARGIVVESKEDVCKRLKRSTDAGDAVMMAWAVGGRAITDLPLWMKGSGHNKKPKPKVVFGHQSARRAR